MRRFRGLTPNLVLAGAGLLLIGFLVWQALPEREETSVGGAIPWGTAPPEESVRPGALPTAASMPEFPEESRKSRQAVGWAARGSGAQPTLAQKLRALLSGPRRKNPPKPVEAKGRKPAEGARAPARDAAKASEGRRDVFVKEALEELGGDFVPGASMGASGSAGIPAPKPADAGPRAFFVPDGVKPKDVAWAKARLKEADRRGGGGSRTLDFFRRTADRPSPRHSVAAASSDGGGVPDLPGGGAGDTQTPGYASAPGQGQAGAAAAQTAGLGGGAQGGGLGTAGANPAPAGTAGGGPGPAGGGSWSWPGASEAGASAVLYQNTLKTDFIRPLAALARRMGEELKPRIGRSCELMTGVYDPARLDRDIAWLAAELPGTELEEDLRSLRREGQDPENTLIRLASAKDTLDAKLSCLSEEDASALDCFAQVRDVLVSRKEFAEWADQSYRDILLPHYNDARSDLAVRCPDCALMTRLEDAQDGLKYYLDSARAAHDLLKTSAWGALGAQGQEEALRLARYGVDQSSGVGSWTASYGRLQQGEAVFTERERLVWRTPHCLDLRFQPLLGDYARTLGSAAAAFARVPRSPDPDERVRLLLGGAGDSVGAYWYLVGCVQLLRAVDCGEVAAVQASIEEARGELGLR
ncbi:MAG TPA: hypothetical protein DCM05_10300 [Elusimicrobia bacterium]|nr:hypothetical protein [Elusimicrobiota bacterium]